MGWGDLGQSCIFKKSKNLLTMLKIKLPAPLSLVFEEIVLGRRGDLGRKVGPPGKNKFFGYVQFPASSMSFNDILTTFSFK